MFVMVDYITEMIVKKSCKYNKYGLCDCQAMQIAVGLPLRSQEVPGRCTLGIICTKKAQVITKLNYQVQEGAEKRGCKE